MTSPELVITRRFDAPRALVWQAWTNPAHATRWGPAGFTTPERTVPTHPGGAWHALMISPDGKPYRQHGVLLEIVPLERLVYTFIWDESPDVEMVVTVTFADRGEQTEMVFRQTGFASVAERDGHRGGWTEAFDALAGVVASLRAER